jgi:cyclopropane fatty-acyl-phospholipid synthase-like methyltransferase
LKYLIHQAEKGKGYLHPLGIQATELLIDTLQIKNGSRLLEIGCGTGDTMIRILSAHNVTIDGIDVLPEMIVRAKQRLRFTGLSSRGNVFDYDGRERLPFDDDFYDIIYSESVLGFQNETNLIKLLKEIYRVLNKGGLFAANDAIWKKDVLHKDIERINKSCLKDFGLSQASEQLWKVDDWLNAFKDAGFEILSFDLIRDILETRVLNKKKKYFKIYLSDFFTNYHSFTGYIKPAIRRNSKIFRNLLVKHSGDGNFIESRLFVLRKN